MGINQTKIAITNNVQYEGEVKDGVPNGKGELLVYCEGQKQQRRTLWKIEGEFQNGNLIKCMAKGQEAMYEGDIKRGTFSGAGRSHNFKEDVFCQGQFQSGVLMKGKVSKKQEFQCQGSFIEVNKQEQSSNKQNVQTISKILCLDGTNGIFRWTKAKQSLQTSFIKGQASGKGVYRFSNNDFYKGEFKKGYFENQGQYVSTSSQLKSLKGHFHKSLPHTSKKSKTSHFMQFRNGDTYVGTFSHGAMHGLQNTYTFVNGTTYKGSLHHNSLTGDCEITYHAGSTALSYKGQIFQGKYHGHGVLTYRNGLILKAYFTQGIKNGPCTYNYGERSWKCLYIMDQLQQPLTQISAHLSQQQKKT